MTYTLVNAEKARLLDAEASAEWGLHPFALVEAAGRACADVFAAAFSPLISRRSCGSAAFPRIAVLAGRGNNGADALVMLRALILRGFASPAFSHAVLPGLPDPESRSSAAECLRSLKKMKVPFILWNGDLGEDAGRAGEDILALADIIIDGLAGTGLRESLKREAGEMVSAVNAIKDRSSAFSRPLVVSIDVPSGNFDDWEPGMPILNADAVLAIEPQKLCLYKPAARPFGGTILPVGGIFPQPLIDTYGGVRLIDGESAFAGIRGVKPEAYKYERGLVEIRAGSPGAAGAAKLAARGAQAAGAGLVRLIVDPPLNSHSFHILQP